LKFWEELEEIGKALAGNGQLRFEKSGMKKLLSLLTEHADGAAKIQTSSDR
jgi:hypothetical protein